MINYIIAIRLPGSIESEINILRNKILKDSLDINSIKWPTIIPLKFSSDKINIRDKSFKQFKFNIQSTNFTIEDGNIYLNFSFNEIKSVQFEELKSFSIYIGKGSTLPEYFTVKCKSASLIQYHIIESESLILTKID